ncbi:MAG TPA: peptidoglycan-associated lipoprotein Pal [Moraxellaceae bacterium]|nr:peptidoglycan-associated lipoprotein Pal [Moraxellaceae bacterium]
MFNTRNGKVVLAAVLALGLAACTTKRADVATEDRGAAAANSASANGNAIGAGTSAANVGSTIDSQPLANDSNAAGAATSAAAGSLLAVRVVHFDYDTADIQQQAVPVLQAHAQYLRSNPGARLTVGGHTDERGTREYNMALGERRAKAVATYLVSNGAKPAQIEVVSFGEEKPLNRAETEAAWAENRRAELSYLAGQPKP